MEKKTLKKRKKKDEEIESWVYILLLASTTILAWVLNKFDFELGKVTLTAAVFVYPFLFFIANIITKKYGVKETINAITYSAGLMLLFAMVSGILTEQEIDYIPLTGELFGYMMSQAINLCIYFYLYMNTMMNKFLLLANYIFAFMINNFIAMFFTSRMVLLKTFWRSFIAIILIQTIISIILILFDNKKIEPKVYKKLMKDEK